jgi:hypothetical protein
MELESGSPAVGGSKGRRCASGGSQRVTWAVRGMALRGQPLASRRRTHDPRHVDDHFDEDAGHDEGAWRS